MSTAAALPAVVVRYFALMDSTDKSAAAALFTPDARVADDGKVYDGAVDIAGWLAREAGAYTFTSTQLSSEVVDDRVIVVNRLEGNFPGGVVDLRHVFVVSGDDRIRALTIAP